MRNVSGNSNKQVAFKCRGQQMVVDSDPVFIFGRLVTADEACDLERLSSADEDKEDDAEVSRDAHVAA